MRTAIASRVLVLMALLLGWLVAPPSTVVALDTSPGEILAHPDQFDQQTVTVRGSVTNLRQTTSQRGHPYYTFDLDDGRRSIRIFSFGHSPCRDGASATVAGTFQRVKRMGRHTFYNQIDAGRGGLPLTRPEAESEELTPSARAPATGRRPEPGGS